MKKNLTFYLLIIIITNIYAQNDVLKFPYKNSIKLSPLSFCNSLFLNYERNLGSKFGVVLSQGIYYYNSILPKSPIDFLRNGLNPGIEGNTIGYLSELQTRFYFNEKQKSEKKRSRLFVAPYGLYYIYNTNDYYYFEGQKSNPTRPDYKLTSFGGGILIGYTFEINKFSIELYTGGGLKQNKTDMDKMVTRHFQTDVFSIAYKGIVPKFGFNLGFNF